MVRLTRVPILQKLRILSDPNESSLVKLKAGSVIRLDKKLRQREKKDYFRYIGFCFSPNTEPDLEQTGALVWLQGVLSF